MPLVAVLLPSAEFRELALLRIDGDFREQQITTPFESIDWSGVFWRKGERG